MSFLLEAHYIFTYQDLSIILNSKFDIPGQGLRGREEERDTVRGEGVQHEITSFFTPYII